MNVSYSQVGADNYVRHLRFMIQIDVAFDEARPLFEDGYERQRAYHMKARIMDELTRSEWNV